MSQVIHFVSKSCPFLVLFLLGALCVLAQAPYHITPCLWLGMAGFIAFHFERRRSYDNFKRLAQDTLVFSMGYYLSLLYWVFYAFEVVGLSWAAPLGIFFLCLYLSVYTLLSALLAHSVSSLYQKFYTFIFPITFTLFIIVFDVLKGCLGPFSFSWGEAAHSWNILPIMQWSYFVSLYGLSFLTLLMGVGFVFYKNLGRIASALLFTLLYGVGFYRMETTQTVPYQNPFYIRLVQASIPQHEKWVASLKKEHLKKHFLLSEQESQHPLHFIIWPEASLSTHPSRIPVEQFMATLSNQTYLLTGAIRVLFSENNSPPFVFNSLFVLTPQGEIFSSYDKERLVPFGEYIPSFCASLMSLVSNQKWGLSYDRGSNQPLINLPDGYPPFLPLICYEGIFSFFVSCKKEYYKRLGKNPLWILNVTNDAWFQNSPGPYQHLHNVRFRAIEHKIPLIRSANHGISAVIDPFGRILKKLDINQVGIIDVALPHPIL